MTAKNIKQYFSSRSLARTLQVAILLLSLAGVLPATAQITIGGNVYGGGENGAVGTGNIDVNSKQKEQVTLTQNITVANVTVSDGNVRTVFGGGKNARTYGQTAVTVEGGEISDVFGAGDGSPAFVFGHDFVTIKDGTINNNVYGGGNEADLIGCTNVTLQGGTFHGSVFGGAKKADIYGYTYVNLDGQNVPAGNTLIIPTVYGGNDISGNIAASTSWSWTNPTTMPFTPSYSQITHDKELVDHTWNAYIHSTSPLTGNPATVDVERNNIFVGSLYSGGNGAYDYTADGFSGLSKPEVAKTYIDLTGGTYGSVFGGGNNATVTESADILVFNQHFRATDNFPYKASIPTSRISEMGMSESSFTIAGEVATANYQIDRIFGGNNLADMAIQPHWYLARGSFNNIYSGGNKGRMTNPDGILVNIGSRGVYANNVYGGCRMADVRPLDASGNDIANIPEKAIQDILKVEYSASGMSLATTSYKFAANYAARVFVTAGHINNVYGGNDISGKVYMGTNVAIAGAISGNVYGGGNGSYAYTDNSDLKDDPVYGDYYYDASTSSSIDALYNYRPHVENTLLHIWGADGQEPQIAEDGTITAKNSNLEPVIITNGVYCGGNSASITGNATATFRIGKNVVINGVFMGSNGENMITKETLSQYAGSVSGKDYSSLNLTDETTFAKYMSGCAVDMLPTIEYDWKNTEDPHTYIGSIFCGGNVGSVRYALPIEITIPEKLKIYRQVVGGCNDADVAARVNLNAAFYGGVITANSGIDASKPKVTLNMKAYLEPRDLRTTFVDNFLASAKLPWNVHEYYLTDTDDRSATRVDGSSFKALEGANVYGGCYTSGMINGSVTVNVNNDLISPEVFTMLSTRNTGTGALLNGMSAAEEFKKMGEYAMTNTMLVYGGGYGEETDIRGDVHVNLSDNARLLSVMGGAEEGLVTGSTYVTAASDLKDYSSENAGALPFNAVAIYGGAYAGLINGHTELRLNGGTFLNAFGGSCNADINGYAATYIGNDNAIGSGYPFIKGYVFGGNDFGGYIKGYNDYREAGYNNQTVRSPRYVEYRGGRVGVNSTGPSSIYGGSYGSYDYSKYYWSTAIPDEADYAPNEPWDGDNEPFHFPLANETVSTDGMVTGTFVTNTFVNIASKSTDKTNDLVARGIFGGGRGMINRTGIVDAKQTYVYSHSATWAERQANLATDIYGGGYYSVVENTLVDLESGCAGFAYGGSYGASATSLDTDALKNIAFNSTRTEVNLYDGMDNTNMAIFGGGGYAGAQDTYVNLYGGRAKNVYGGSYNEGFCNTTHVDVPEGSTASVNAIFGGGYGNNVALPCDEEVTNVNFSSSTAYVADAIYGGNNAKRAAKTTNVNIYAPVRKSATGAYVSVCGAGNGESTVAGFTNVNLFAGARVNNIYGGGRDGKVYGYYQNITDATTYYSSDENKDHHASWNYENIGVEDSWEGSSMYEEVKPESGTNLFGFYTKDGNKYTACSSTSTADGSTLFYRKKSSTTIIINQGAIAENVYGGGYGDNATVTGSTRAHLHGGTIIGNLYGGGYSGDVTYQKLSELSTASETIVSATGSQADFETAQKGNIYTYACVWGGEVNAVYGGGYNGNVGENHTNLTAETRVEIGEDGVSNHLAGSPTILRSVYGGGFRGAVLGTAKIQMLGGYIGYKYDSSEPVEANRYKEYLTLSDDDERELLIESGNIFGGGFGEGATTDNTIVNMYGGVLRNSLYGGGEIASVGVADEMSINVTNRAQIPNITVPGRTEINMYGGLVTNDVFGGGRGYAIDDEGNMATGERGYSDGYTFGQTNVNIYRGTIGTRQSVAQGYGNVFGGGNIGYVYGASSTKNSGGTYYNVTKGADNYYHLANRNLSEDCKVVISPYLKVISDAVVTVNGHTYQKGDFVVTEDLNRLQSSASEWDSLDKLGVNIGNAVFAGGNVSAGSDKVYANTKTIYGNATASVLDVLNKDFITLGEDGIGGLYGDGNLTFVDGYRELNITNYGTDYYNLNNSVTIDQYKNLSDRERAYFELLYESKSQHTYVYYTCLETYTDAHDVVYKKNQKISPALYDALPNDEKTHWSSSSSSKNYGAGDTIEESVWSLFDSGEQSNWEQKGFCTLYAGRMLNTIQRADFCGVFGSRVVLKGAQDRVPSVVDYTDYTINRVGELSLNQAHKSSMNPSTDDPSRSNYFGIYNVVNYLGAITSDITWDDARVTANTSLGYKEDVDGKAYGTATYYEWKHGHLGDRKRNNGSSRNEVALASGVWLEIVKDLATTDYKDATDGLSYKKGDKIYGPITGIVELNLINVATGEGGGYVYAKNIHGTATKNGSAQATLSSANNNAESYKLYTYSKLNTDDGTHKMQSSGNFVNSMKRIIDDCYPQSGAYYGANAATAHYWYIRGEFYVYDQYISAYTGSSQPYAKDINIPLTITPEARGRLSLYSIEKNHYAYWTETDDQLGTYKSTSEDDAIVVNGVTYHKNDPISDWEWSRLSEEEQTRFFTASGIETYACTKAFTYNRIDYNEGDALMPADYDALSNDVYICVTSYKLSSGEVIEVNTTKTAAEYAALEPRQKEYYLPLKDFFHVSNAINHDNGFLLTFDWDNPNIWDDYYINVSTRNLITKAQYNALTTEQKKDYVISPTFTCSTAGVLGQKDYKFSEIIDDVEYQAQSALGTNAPSGQAEFKSAYAAKETVEIGANYYVKGACISVDDFNNMDATNKAFFAPAFICTETYQDPTSGEYFTYGCVYTSDDIANIASLTDNFKPAYTCTTAGKWGGKYFASGQNYKALDICNLSSDERAKFTYNYDALDLLSENFRAHGDDIIRYQGAAENNANKGIAVDPQIPFAEETSIDYTAVYTGTENVNLSKEITVTRSTGSTTTKTLQPGDKLTCTVYENDLVNEQFNYTPLIITGEKYRVNSDITDAGGNTVYVAGSYLTEAQYTALTPEQQQNVSAYDMKYYVVNKDFRNGNTWYCVGNTISETVYETLSGSLRDNVTIFSASDLKNPGVNDRFYFCTKNYTAQTAISGTVGNTSGKVNGTSVYVGALISPDVYSALPNEQKNFSIDGVIPTETTTLYVARETDIDELSKDRIVTVTYWYEYIESDESGSSYETIRERHIINVHIHFESGVPVIGKLMEPNIVLPGTGVALSQPSVSKGAYEILGGGWELFSDESDAEAHKNGEEYINNSTKVYLYENGYYIAYYAKTYLGKTYSNAVPVRVANFHRMEDVMTSQHKEVIYDAEGNATDNFRTLRDYMFIDKAAAKVGIIPKIYINDHECKDTGKTELDYMADLYNLSTTTASDSLRNVMGCRKIDFILQSDVAPNGSWTPLGTAEKCFSGNFHGDGHTISGLDHSLFSHFCGNIYNTGVTGSFTGAGIADHADGNRAVNCWTVSTAQTMDNNVLPIFGTVSNNANVANSYYYNDYNISGIPAAWSVHQKPVGSFLDGEVAFNLNGYYLNARKKIEGRESTTGATNHYYKLNSEGTIEQQHSDIIDADENKRYDIKYASEDSAYVENRFINGDFIYAGGVVPKTSNIRLFTNGSYYPVYPDDYIYFGQRLTFDIADGAEAHQEHPYAILRDEETGLLAGKTDNTNRVFRTPAYYMSKEMSDAYFNYDAAFAGQYTTKAGGLFGAAQHPVYDKLTAIDFTAYGDTNFTDGSSQASFFKPYTDYNGLESFQVKGITQNLLVYADPTNDANSYSKLNSYLAEPTLTQNEAVTVNGKTYDNDYNNISIAASAGVRGHLVDKSGSGYVASRNHFLVDMQNFNAPISYQFNGGKYMWYQRTPSVYADGTKGWETICLPFTADLVTTHQKGEITHFYGSDKINAVGHEYWLRGFKGITTGSETKAQFIRPMVSGTGADTRYETENGGLIADNTVHNTFLWDFYYSRDSRQDENSDLYQKYYADGITYNDYVYYAAKVPYIISFPGDKFYEFDMSGNFVPEHTYGTVDRLARQVVSFVSQAGQVIAVSDNEDRTSTANSYKFRGFYQADDFDADSYYALDAEGKQFDKGTEDGKAVPFRAYFRNTDTRAKSILIGEDAEYIDSPETNLIDGSIQAYGQKRVLHIVSHLDRDVVLPVYTTQGQLVKMVDLKAGAHEQIPLAAGIYLVQGRKVAVK